MGICQCYIVACPLILPLSIPSPPPLPDALPSLALPSSSSIKFELAPRFDYPPPPPPPHRHPLHPYPYPRPHPHPPHIPYVRFYRAPLERIATHAHGMEPSCQVCRCALARPHPVLTTPLGEGSTRGRGWDGHEVIKLKGPWQVGKCPRYCFFFLVVLLYFSICFHAIVHRTILELPSYSGASHNCAACLPLPSPKLVLPFSSCPSGREQSRPPRVGFVDPRNSRIRLLVTQSLLTASSTISTGSHPWCSPHAQPFSPLGLAQLV